MDVNYDYKLQDWQNENPVVFKEDWRPEFATYLIESSDDFVLGKLFPNKKAKLKTWGATKTSECHYISVNRGTPLHIDKGYKRYSHQLILYVNGFVTSGLSKEETLLYSGLYHILDGHSPHKLDNKGNTDSRYVAVAIDSDTILNTSDVKRFILDYLKSNRILDTYDYEQKNL